MSGEFSGLPVGSAATVSPRLIQVIVDLLAMAPVQTTQNPPINPSISHPLQKLEGFLQ
ncbi:hypothetical protein QF010_004018 [Pseudomonas silensiensis]